MLSRLRTCYRSRYRHLGFLDDNLVARDEIIDESVAEFIDLPGDQKVEKEAIIKAIAGRQEGMIAGAREDLSNGGLAAREDGVGAAPDSKPGAAEDIAGQVKVNVTLDDSLRDRVSDQDTVFVFARALNGPPMPLAVIRKRVVDLPLVVTLDDSMAMTPQMKLSNHKEVTIIAKVSKTGEAKTQSGELIGEVSPVSTGNGRMVSVLISTQAP